MTPNPQQLDIINHVDGPCLVTAVPGSGKTAAITERIKGLVAAGKDPVGILALTFTNKAADEMRRRIALAVGDSAAKMTICTFHSLCARILRANAPRVGRTRSFAIYDEDGQERLLKICMAKLEGEDFKPSDKYFFGLLAFLEGKRNACLTDEEGMAKYGIDARQLAICKEYEVEIRRSDAFDFTGLLSEALDLLSKNPDVLRQYQEGWRYISVDEVQDTNLAQYRLLSLLAAGHKNIVCVGDADQSLYRWRSATLENIFSFEKDFGAKVLKLEKNYRSTPQILAHSQRLIEHNKLRKETTLVTDNPSGPAPVVSGHDDENDMAMAEVDFVASAIRKGTPPSEVAIFFRTNYATRIIEQALRARGIRYKVIGGMSFFNRQEVKASLAILGTLCNPNDRISFEKTVEACCRGVGTKTTAAIVDVSRQKKVDILAAAREHSLLVTPQARALRGLIKVLDQTAPRQPHDRLLRVAQDTSFWQKMRRLSKPGNDRCANIEEVSIDLARYVGDGGTLAGYLQNVSLLSDADEDGKDNEVRLMTLHSCKGLEFDVVLISHAGQGMIPHFRVLGIEDEGERAAQLEEERRLFYVGMTRARKRLGIFWSAKRRTQGGEEDVEPSAFIGEAGLDPGH